MQPTHRLVRIDEAADRLDLAGEQPLPITPVAAASEVAKRLTCEICDDAASAPLRDQLAKTVRERLVTESPSRLISVPIFCQCAARPVSLSSSALGNLPAATATGMSGEVHSVIMRSPHPPPDRCW
jgi:hypothetical protein